ncbi:MAG TPA: tetratricopeptide repeat protein [Vicinamibacterales bacterium]|nr:tetratricopeptide repeat protein [Vicinamibacterales bacterium]
MYVFPGCAPKAAPVVPGAPKHPDFIYPVVPAGTKPDQASRIERGWQYLQLDDHRNAELEFGTALKQQPSFAPAETGMAYLAMARGNEKDAAARFERALQVDAAYVPALIGRGQVMLELDRDADALASFEAALAKDPSLTDLRSRVDVLKFRATQDLLGRGKAAADARRWDEAATIYRQAIAASPDSGFLYRDLATVEQRAGQPANALEHYRKAVEIDSSDARSHAGIAAILEAQGDVVAALEEYERARALDPSEASESAINRLRAAAALAKLPGEYRAIPSNATVTRAEIAALVGIKLETVLARAQPRQVIITDIRGHWAQPWIAPVVRAGVMDTLPNYEFEPRRQSRRGELATTVSRLLTLIGSMKPDLAKKWQATRVTINDVSASHLSYPAVSAAVAAGVMPLSNGNFELLRPVTGAEAMDIISRLEALARP